MKATLKAAEKPISRNRINDLILCSKLGKLCVLAVNAKESHVNFPSW